MLSMGYVAIWSAAVLLGGEPEIRGNAFVELTSELGGGVNSGNESAPSLSPDGLTLLFASGRAGGQGNWDIYMATRTTPEGPFVEVTNVGPPVNTAGGEAWAQISLDGRTLFFVRGGNDRVNNSIWIAQRPDPGSPFLDAMELPGIGIPGSSDVTPFLSLDGSTLLFSSIRSGGVGWYDLWISTRSDPEDDFGPPMLLEDYLPGSLVNSVYDEMAPSPTADGLTLFLSDSFKSPFRPGGKGGADMWVATRSDVEEPFGEPVNLNDLGGTRGVPINGSGYDLFPSVSTTWPLRGSEVYFVSDRSGTLAIWRATWEAVPEPSFTVVGPDAGGTVTVDASASSTPEGTEPLSFAWDFGDGTSGEWSTAAPRWETYTHAYAAPGRYRITLTAANSLGVEATVTVTAMVTVGCGPHGDVSPWIAADVGSPLLPGSAWKEGEDLLVCAGGRGFVGSADEFHFVHQAFTGDFEFTVRVSDVIWDVGASVGLLARESLEPGARYGAILLEKQSTSVLHSLRYREAAASLGKSRLGPEAEVPRWLRLERCGDLFLARSSADGVTWEEVDRQTIAEMPATLLVGLAATGKDTGDPARAFTPLWARLSGLEIAPFATGFVRGEANQDGAVDLSDAVATLGYLFLGGSIECLDAADADDSGALEITDAIYSLNFLFLGGPQPPAPFPECGPDPSTDPLGCEIFAGCGCP